MVQLESEGFYNDDKLEGIQKLWYPGGQLQLQSEGFYKDGIK